jgi:uncharacterized membrane protein required for colicin V production
MIHLTHCWITIFLLRTFVSLPYPGFPLRKVGMSLGLKFNLVFRGYIAQVFGKFTLVFRTFWWLELGFYPILTSIVPVGDVKSYESIVPVGMLNHTRIKGMTFD